MADWSKAGSGALAGAGTGAAIGTAFAPGIGTAIGAGGGALLGALPGILANDPNAQLAKAPDPFKKKQAQAAANRVKGAGNRQKAFIDALQQQNALANQTQVYNQLQAQIAGTGPSVAQNQLAQATQQNIANQAALAAGQRGAGANAGLVSRNAAVAGTNAQQQAIQQMATLRAQ